MQILHVCERCKTIFDTVEITGDQWVINEFLQETMLCPKCGGWVKAVEKGGRSQKTQRDESLQGFDIVLEANKAFTIGGVLIWTVTSVIHALISLVHPIIVMSELGGEGTRIFFPAPAIGIIIGVILGFYHLIFGGTESKVVPLLGAAIGAAQGVLLKAWLDWIARDIKVFADMNIELRSVIVRAAVGVLLGACATVMLHKIGGFHLKRKGLMD